MCRGSGPKLYRPRTPRRALSVLYRYSVEYLPTSWDRRARMAPPERRFEEDTVESLRSVIGDMRRR